MDKSSLIFCGSALALCLGLAALAFPFAALPPAKAASAKTAVDAATLGEINLGSFGKVSVSDMMSYYIENPPEPETGAAATKKVRFEGC